jgi:phosphatidylinositol alpha-mannosyltransferase
VIVPAAFSLANVCLTPQTMRRMKRAFERERFDVVHVHEPLAPVISPYAIAAAPCPVVATVHSSGGRWCRDCASVGAARRPSVRSRPRAGRTAP